MKIQKELDEIRKALEDSEAWFKAQHEKDSSAIRDLENAFHARLEEITEMDKHLFGKFFNAFPKFCIRFLAFFWSLIS